MKQKRITELAHYIEKKDFVRLEELSEAFGVSLITIRRDVAELCASGRVEKVYGGVRPAKKIREVSLRSFQLRAKKFVEEKDHIGRIAASFIAERDTIFVDAGTTALYLLRYLENMQLNIITNNLGVAELVADKPDINVILLGGTYVQAANSTEGEMTLENLKELNIRKAFITPAGASIKNGYTNSTFNEIMFKRFLIKHAVKRYILLDHSKWNFSSAMTVAPLEEADVIISDMRPPENFMEFYDAHEILVRY